jgi:hypothetical protein
MVYLGQQGSEVLRQPDNPAQKWWLCRAFDGGDGGGGASRLLRWSRLALVGDR